MSRCIIKFKDARRLMETDCLGFGASFDCFLLFMSGIGFWLIVFVVGSLLAVRSEEAGRCEGFIF